MVLLILFLWCIPPVSVYAQTPGFEDGPPTTEGTAAEQTQQEQHNPPAMGTEGSMPLLKTPSIPYRESTLGRALVLSIGVFPFSYFYTGLAMDLVRFSASNFDPSYAPWPFRTQNSIAYTNSEMWIKLGVSAAVSILFGTLSALLK